MISNMKAPDHNMIRLLRNLRFRRTHKMLCSCIAISLLCGILSQYWQVWLVFGFVLSVMLVVHFSRGFSNPLNIHSAAVSLITIFALPSSILILNNKIALDRQESLMVFSSISMGLMGYAFGALLLKHLVSFDKKKNTLLSKRVNALFWLSYKYRYVLAFISAIVLLYWGFMPRSMSYTESITYRMETTGAIEYFRSLIPNVFSVLMVAMISIFGDLRKQRKLFWLSYLLIGLVVFSIVGGHRSWIVALFACLAIAFRPYLKKRHFLLFIILAIVITFVISGGVRYARGGGSFTEILGRFQEYSLNVELIGEFTRKWSDLTTPFSTFITLVKNIPQNVSFDYAAYIKDSSLLIPEIIYPNRPLPYNEWFVKTFRPEVYQRGGGLTFYVVGFGYLFAGPIGVFIHLFLFGALFELLNKSLRMINGAAALFLYSYFFVQLLGFVRSCGFMVFIKNSLILYLVIPIMLLFLFVLILQIFDLGNSKIRNKELRYKLRGIERKT